MKQPGSIRPVSETSPRIRNVLGVLTIAAIATRAIHPYGQERGEQLASASFEVASVKPSTARDTAMRIIWPRGRFSAVNVTTRQFVEAAYKVEPFRVQGGPGWLTANRFNIDATIPTDAVIVQARGMPDAIRAMMQRLLADRFSFLAHWERKQQTVYALVLARRDRQLGPHLQKSEVDCAALFAARRQGAPLPNPSVCGVQRGPGRLVAGAYLMAQLADTLAASLQQVVVDRTGLAGAYDIDLTWSPEQTGESGPSLFAAVQEQLGLKLESTKAPVDVLVIDHVDRPTQN
jgi:uncharacterized protein (TIGR03435 family)